jgi:hypothetical protein
MPECILDWQNPLQPTAHPVRYAGSRRRGSFACSSSVWACYIWPPPRVPHPGQGNGSYSRCAPALSVNFAGDGWGAVICRSGLAPTVRSRQFSRVGNHGCSPTGVAKRPRPCRSTIGGLTAALASTNGVMPEAILDVIDVFVQHPCLRREIGPTFHGVDNRIEQALNTGGLQAGGSTESDQVGRVKAVTFAIEAHPVPVGPFATRVVGKGHVERGRQPPLAVSYTGLKHEAPAARRTSICSGRGEI